MKNLIVMTLAMLIAGSAAAAGTTDHFLADRHVERGVKCESCHVNGDTTNRSAKRSASCATSLTKRSRRRPRTFTRTRTSTTTANATARRATRVTSRARFPAASATSSI